MVKMAERPVDCWEPLSRWDSLRHQVTKRGGKWLNYVATIIITITITITIVIVIIIIIIITIIIIIVIIPHIIVWGFCF